MSEEELLAFRYGVKLGALEEREITYRRILDIDPEGTYSEGWCQFIVDTLRRKDSEQLIKGENE